MRFVCLVCDYDGTLAKDGIVAASTAEALKRLCQSGRRLVLDTGRELGELLEIFPEISLFERVVAENGALLFRPASKETKVLADAPPPEFVEELRRRGVTPLQVGHGIVATWRPNETIVLDVIRDLGLGLQVIFNKEAVMVLPSTINKASGMLAAFEEMGISRHNAVGIGDAENDHAFLSLCECNVAVENALPSLKERADYNTQSPRGAGVEELIEMLLADDLASLEDRLQRHHLLLGKEESGAEYNVRAYNSRLLISGPSGGGKSTTVSALIERLLEHGYQTCLVDPEGDYDDLEQFVTLGGPERIPASSEILEVLKKPENSLSINLLGVPLGDRPGYFLSLLPTLQELRARTGRPHWVIIDEAHHLLPAESQSAQSTIPKELTNLLLITVHPNHTARTLLEAVNGLLIIGPRPEETVEQFREASGLQLESPELAGGESRSGKIVAWMFGNQEDPKLITLIPAKIELKRHRRKYATGELDEEKSFYFRGAENKLNLRAQNLKTFIQLAQGIDDETWLYHLRKGEYSSWFRETIKDAEVAAEIEKIERDSSLSLAEGKSQIIHSIEQHYTAPA
jgi:hydroxymethylpyrimidine pyrophosphatase-like HAD family hydrolase